MSTAERQQRKRRADPLNRFTAAYAVVAVAASIAALRLQVSGHFSGLFGTLLVLVAVPAIISAIALGCSSTVALAGIVHEMFFSHAVRVGRAPREMTAAK